MNRFQDKTVLVTGLAAARAFAAEGARVVVTGRDAAALDKALAELGPRAIAVRNDAGAPGAAKELAAAIAGHGVKLDAVFLNAGIAKFSGLADVTEAFWDEIFDVNVKGAFFQIQAVMPL